MSMQTAPSFYPIALKHGLITGIAAVLLEMAAMHYSVEPTTIGTITRFIFITGLLLAMHDYKHNLQNGYLRYKQGLRLGILTGIVYGAVYGIYMCLFLTYISPDMLQELAQALKDNLDAESYSSEEVEAYNEMVARFTTPIVFGLSMVFGHLILAVLFSAILAVFVRREEEILEE